MTPSEKKARECVDAGSKCSCIKGDEPCERHQIYAIELALDAAERRGFERAKGACIEKAKTYRHYAVKGVPTSNKIIYELENLKYEEEA